MRRAESFRQVRVWFHEGLLQQELWPLCRCHSRHQCVVQLVLPVCLLCSCALHHETSPQAVTDGHQSADRMCHVHAACVDIPLPSNFTCAQQRDFGKCGADFMVGFCDATCGRCTTPIQDTAGVGEAP